MTFRVGNEFSTGAPAIFAFAPQGPHTLANLGEREARILVFCTPAGFEHYFEQLAAGRTTNPPPDQAIAVGPPIGQH
jgi:hypothetical protein